METSFSGRKKLERYGGHKNARGRPLITGSEIDQGPVLSFEIYRSICA